MHAPEWFRLAVAAAVLTPGVPPVAQQTLAIDLNLSGLAHFADNGQQQVRRYVSMGYGTVTPFGSASYAMSGDVDPKGAKGLSGVLTVSLPGGSGFEASFSVASFPTPAEGQTTTVSTAAVVSSGMGDLAGASGNIPIRISVKSTSGHRERLRVSQPLCGIGQRGCRDAERPARAAQRQLATATHRQVRGIRCAAATTEPSTLASTSISAGSGSAVRAPGLEVADETDCTVS